MHKEASNLLLSFFGLFFLVYDAGRSENNKGERRNKKKNKRTTQAKEGQEENRAILHLQAK